MVQALLLSLVAPSYTLPLQPSETQLRRGGEIYVRGKGIERVLLEDRVVLGLWFSGRKHEDVEEVIRLSPDMLARWMGYLVEKEKWDVVQLNERWEGLREAIGDRMLYVVRVSAMPRMGLEDLEPKISRAADPREVTELRYMFDFDGLRVEPAVTPLLQWNSRRWQDLEGFKWHLSLPFGHLLAGEFERPGELGLYPIGDYYSAWYLLEVRKAYPARERLYVFSPEKRREAQFGKLK